MIISCECFNSKVRTGWRGCVCVGRGGGEGGGERESSWRVVYGVYRHQQACLFAYCGPPFLEKKNFTIWHYSCYKCDLG